MEQRGILWHNQAQSNQPILIKAPPKGVSEVTEDNSSLSQTFQTTSRSQDTRVDEGVSLTPPARKDLTPTHPQVAELLLPLGDGNRNYS